LGLTGTDAFPLTFPGTKQPEMNADMTTAQIKELIAILLKSRPDLVVVKTENQGEKTTLVKILKNAGGKVIYRK
jgi:hypothetical protein